MVNLETLDFEKENGLIPAIIIEDKTHTPLMLGFMNREALDKTMDTKLVTFYSRTRKTLWTKGETSGNYLHVLSIKSDCDNDTLLIAVQPDGPTCHTGDFSCFKEDPSHGISFLSALFELIKKRKETMPENSYTTRLFKEGENRIIQKVGEEAIETVIAAKNRDKKELIDETSDLFFHLFVMLVDQGVALDDIVENLRKRHQK